MASKCTECGDTESYNFALNIGLCNPCIGERLEELEVENKKLRAIKCPPISDGDSCICPIEELEAQLEQHRWIPVSERLPEEGNCLVLCKGKIYEVKVRISEDEWEDNKGKSFMQETAHCNLEHLGTILIGHDVCITHWKPIILP